MQRYRLWVFLLAPLLVLLVALNFYTTSQRIETPADEPTRRNLWPGTGRWATAVLDTLTLEQKVSQLFCVYADGYFNANDDAAYQRLESLVADFGAGGVIFFQGTPLVQVALTNALQEKARIPLLVAQDLEWGLGMRLEGLTAFPHAMALGATRDASLVYNMGRTIAAEARAMGVHQNFAPVADVNNNPNNPTINTRSFGERPDLVATMAAAYVSGLQDGDVIATAKHFPGHGDTSVGADDTLPVLPFDLTRLNRIELVPFRQVINEGLMSVMTAHIALPQIEPDTTLPATLSPRIVRGILRDDLNFTGLIVTDGLNKAGVTAHYGVGEAAVRALEAGVDLLLLSEDEIAARRAILQAIEEGRLDEDRIDRSVYRILRAKEWLRLNAERTVNPRASFGEVSTRTHRALADELARRSITLAQNTDNLLPLATDTTRLLLVTLSDTDDADRGAAFRATVRQHKTDRRTSHRLLDRRSRSEDYQDVLTDAADYDVVVVSAFIAAQATDRAALPLPMRDFLNTLINRSTPVALLSFGDPYLVRALTAAPAAYMLAYSDVPSSQEAVAHALFGASAVSGQLPVSIPGLAEYGTGLKLSQVTLRADYPEVVGMDGATLSRVDSLIQAAIADRAFPGAAVAIGRAGVLTKLEGYGYNTYDSDRRVTPSSRFDLASLTKVIATTSAAMKLYEEGRLALDEPVATYLPSFGRNGKEVVTIRQLLTHTSGMHPFYPFHTMNVDSRQAIFDFIDADSLRFAPGSESRYSDLNMITLMRVIEAVSGRSFADYVRLQFFEPLGMTQTGFLGTGTPDRTVVPTEVDNAYRRRLIQGEVHDEAAWIQGGVSGHAGLFSTATDLARFAYMLVNDGVANGRRFFKPETIDLFTSRVAADSSHTRALGWDTRSLEGYSSAGTKFGPRSFGHTGFTGTSLWIDPDQRLFVILLTNRVYPTRDNRKISGVRPALADLAFDALIGPPEYIPPYPKK